ncbi:hypothetical protein OS493_031724 [Desmophyllum pertusum]|uniref:Amine oxidase n=1 Tax=Desmophyllum pertusum TaxID=174260 RepID=A0A9X0D257_9CNID|nr:hypothetical protein OS493_031724 [Desmophyllum pertusum]
MVNRPVSTMLNKVWLLMILYVLQVDGRQFPVKRAKTRRTKVLILGAGVAGIVAAKTLEENGIKDFLILEAQDYIGGRFKQRSFAGVKLEEGANWIHYADDKPNPLWELKQKHNLRGIFTNYSDVIIRDEKGQDITDRDLLNQFMEVEEKLIELSELKSKDHRPDMSVRAALSSMGWKPDTPAKRVIEYSVLDFEFAVKPKMESLMGSGSRSLDFFVADPRGYGSIFVKMADHFKDRILLNKIVKSVSYSRYGVRVTTVDGETFAANYGLCTFSSGVLASDSVSFSPKLPQWKLEAINKIQMAHYTKIFIKFPYKFWDSHEFILYAHHIRGYYPVWMDLKARDIFPGSAILHVTVTGEMGIKVEGQSESETLKEIMTELRKVYGSNIPNAEGIFYSKWSNNPFVRGSYANPEVGTTNADFHNLGGKLGKLYFAGEATDPDWWGFAQGAYFTGESKATEIAQCMKGNCTAFWPKANFVQEIYINP